MRNTTENIDSIRSTVGAAMSALDGTAGLVSSIVNTVEIISSDSAPIQSRVNVMLTCVVQGNSFTARRRKRDIAALQSASNNALQQVGGTIASDMSTDEEVISMTGVAMEMPEFSEWEKPEKVTEMCVDYCQNGGRCEIMNPFEGEKECNCENGYIGETCSEKRTSVLENTLTTSSEAGLSFGMLVGLGVLFYCM